MAISYLLTLVEAYLSTQQPASRRTITIGTRDSLLALAQTKQVEDYLRAHYPDLEIKLHSLKTSADKNLATPLHQMAAKSLWTYELETLLVSGEVDMIVHSLKDMPTVLPERCQLGAILPREDPRDALIIREGLPYRSLAELPAGSQVGTSSVRRMAQIKKAYPHLELIDLRGNIGTRCKKVDNPELGYTGAILAVAGLKRLGMDGRIVEYLSGPTMLHAVGQGGIGVEIRAGDEEIAGLLEGIKCAATTKATLAERSLLRTLEGGCSVPIGVETRWSEDGKVLEMQAVVCSVDGSQSVEVEGKMAVGTEEEAEEFGMKMAGRLVEGGAKPILEACTAKRPTTVAETL